MKKLECIYTGAGFQRPVNIDSEIISFDLRKAPEGSFVQFSEMRWDILNSSKDVKEAYDASFQTLRDTSGVLTNVGSIRVFIASYNDGFSQLDIQPQNDPTLGCIGELTKMNCTLQRMNRDMRTMAVIAGA